MTLSACFAQESYYILGLQSVRLYGKRRGKSNLRRSQNSLVARYCEVRRGVLQHNVELTGNRPSFILLLV
jgi:hypothetical protein